MYKYSSSQFLTSTIRTQHGPRALIKGSYYDFLKNSGKYREITFFLVLEGKAGLGLYGKDLNNPLELSLQCSFQ